MKVKSFSACLVVLTLATAASAQTKLSGTAQCAKPDAQHMIEIGDRPNHSFMISQGKCTWTKPLEYEGIQSKEGVTTPSDEVSGNTSRTHGYYVDTMANGDKARYRYEGKMALKDGKPESAEGTWTLVGGTGKLKGIKAKGTYKGQASGEGMTYEIEGEYETPKK